MQLKYQKKIFAPAILISTTILFLFQNCAGQKEQESILSSLDAAAEINQYHVADTSVEKLALSEPSLLMNRKVMYSLFVDIFGPSSSQIAILNKLKSDKAVFGAPCSIYGNFKSSRAAFAADAESDPCTNSLDANQLGAEVEPSGNALHQATVSDICVRGTENAAVLEYIMTQIRDVPAVAVPVTSDANILKLVALFYRGKPAPVADLVIAMRKVVGTPATADGWKRAFLATCSSVHWQTL